MQRATHFKIREGLCFDERNVGTCGFSLVKRLGKPLQITGCEHYSAMLHYVTGAYAPIFEPNTKKLIGVFGVAGAKTLPNPHTLAIVVAATTAIENLIELNQARQDLFVFAKSLQIAINSLEDGVILVDKDRRICEVNSVAIKVLGLEKEHICGKDISELRQFSELEDAITDSLRFKKPDVRETDCRINNKTYLASIKSLRKVPHEGVQGAIVQLKNVSELREIFQKLAGDSPRYTIANMVGSSKQMLEIKNLVNIAAKSDGSVIIEGESGTGKEVIAQAIHNASSRKKRPFEVINCAAIPHELLESTLFGHEKGSFTGASSTHIGKFELGDEGTLFFDEISDMSPAMQAKMLRAIEERKIERVGGKRPFDVDVKIIAATNRNLYDLVRKKLFRADLFYRLNVFLISLPPLRDRKGDIFELVHTFLAEFAPFSQKAITKVSDAYFDILLNYDWPGNIRELRNFCER
ncbi:sigma 54-interacting transcriptional regulator, partial [bacterium]|nr:sigma 54-interacting transcriptional regulator [bacterium]